VEDAQYHNQSVSFHQYEGKETRKDHMEAANIVLANIQKLQARNEMALLNQYDSGFFDMIIIDDGRDIIGTNQRKPSKIKGSQMI